MRSTRYCHHHTSGTCKKFQLTMEGPLEGASASNSAIKPVLQWGSALREVCWNMGVLAVPISTVVKTFIKTHKIPNAQSSELTLWDTTHNPALAIRKQRVNDAVKVVSASSFEYLSSLATAHWTSFYGTPRKIVSAVLSPMTMMEKLLVGSHSDYENIRENMAESASQTLPGTFTTPDISTKQTSTEEIPPDAIIVCTELACECLSLLERVTNRQDRDTTVVIPSLARWVMENATAEDSKLAHFIARLPATHLALLIICLDAESTIAVVPTRPHLYYIRGCGKLKQHDLNIAVTVYDLQHSIKQKETELQRLEDQAIDALCQARSAKQKSDTVSAVHHMQRRSLYKKNMEITRAILLNLHQALEGVESARHQASVVSSLKRAADTLSQIRIEEGATNDILDDLAEQMAALNVQSDSFATMTPTLEDDELLIELETLKKEDLILPVVSANISTIETFRPFKREVRLPNAAETTPS